MNPRAAGASVTPDAAAVECATLDDTCQCNRRETSRFVPNER